MTEIQCELIEILKIFIETCDEHDIKYSLSFGTLLGAIRHKGIIPWDDDIDVMIKRSDCKRLKSAFEEKHIDNIFLQNYQSDKNYPFPFLTIRKLVSFCLASHPISLTLLSFSTMDLKILLFPWLN